MDLLNGRAQLPALSSDQFAPRCIGDHTFKSDPKLPLDRQMVVCDPEVTVAARTDVGIPIIHGSLDSGTTRVVQRILGP